MINGLHTSALGAFGQSSRLDMISNNLANIDTPGFRRESMAFTGRLVEALEDDPDFDHYNAFVDRFGGAPFIEGTRFDASPGPLRQTDRPLDFAINGAGYFGVVDPRTGERFYTRAGNFVFGPEGLLMTSDGRYSVVDEGGAPIQVDLSGSSELQVNSAGQIQRVTPGGNEAAGQLALFDLPADELTKHGDTQLRWSGEGLPPVTTGSTIAQGYLEGSSVNPIEEMAMMIQTSRLIEANLQMVRFQDATLDRAINTLGRTG